MEFLLELLFDIIVEGSIELSTQKKVPMPLRILALIISFGIFGFLAAIFFFVGYDFVTEHKSAPAILFFIIGAAVVTGFFYMIWKTYRDNNLKDSDDDNDDNADILEVKPPNEKHVKIACIAACAWIIMGVGLFYFTNFFKDDISDKSSDNNKTEQTTTEMSTEDNSPVYISNVEEYGIVMTVKDVTPTSLTLIMELADKDSDMKYSTGTWFFIEQWVNDTWKILDYKDNSGVDIVWNDVAYEISAQSTSSFEKKFSSIYDELSPGKYRIGKEIDSDNIIFAEFEVTE